MVTKSCTPFIEGSETMLTQWRIMCGLVGLYGFLSESLDINNPKHREIGGPYRLIFLKCDIGNQFVTNTLKINLLCTT